jgi:NAD(P)H-dependent FMN reductase
MLKIAIIIGSTRPIRRGEAVGRWVFERARARGDADYELIDLKEINLPFLDEPKSPGAGDYQQPHTLAWSARIAPFDAYVFVTPEYNHGVCAPLKNALDTLYREWNNKAAGFVAYGNAGGARAVEHLRATASELQMATVQRAVHMSIFTDWDKMNFHPAELHQRSLNQMLDQLIAWGGALQTLRGKP